MKVAKHPSTVKRYQAAAKRWNALKEQHRLACDRLWLGTVAINFTSSELKMLADFLSPHDHALLAAARRFTE